jgi:hypothetical protein
MRFSGIQARGSLPNVDGVFLLDFASTDELLGNLGQDQQGESDMPMKRAFVSNMTAAPAGAGDTVVLFATHPRMPGGSGTAVTSTFADADGLNLIVPHGTITRMDAVFGRHDHASAANGLRAYYTNDGGTTWLETDMKGPDDQGTIGTGHPIQVPVLSSGLEWAEVFAIDRYRGFALEYIAGATPPTIWDVTVSVAFIKEN